MVRRVLLASPRGYCAGVERAIDTVERALELWGPPVYVRRQIVHNAHVVRDFEQRGVVFVDSEQEVPAGEVVILSAHGVAPEVRAAAGGRGLRVVDATCPLVTKVHSEARTYAALGYTIILIGHADHDEVVGTLGEAPGATVLVQTAAEAARLELPRGGRIAYLMQTTLSVDDAGGIVDILQRRFPEIEGPRSDDICYATANRQMAVKAVAPLCQLLLVVGSQNSSNSKRLVEVCQRSGVPAYLIDDHSYFRDAWFEGVDTVSVTAGASAPENLVLDVIEALRERGYGTVEEMDIVDEDVRFNLPPELQGGAAKLTTIAIR